MANYTPQSGSLGSAGGTPIQQGPGPPSYQASDRVGVPGICSMSKTPNYVQIVGPLTNTAGFFFGSSGSFAKAAGTDNADHNQLSASTSYSINLSGSNPHGTYAGTRLDIHPIAWSGSLADKDKVIFVYKGGLDGSGRG